MHLKANVKELAAGGLFIAFGAIYGGTAWNSLAIGTALNMGPGYFPIFLSGLLVCIGLVIGARGLLNTLTVDEIVIPWRSLIMISLSTIVFATLLDELGFIITVFVSSFLAAMSDPAPKIKQALAVSLLLSVGCAIIFGKLLGLPIPLFGTWIGV